MNKKEIVSHFNKIRHEDTFNLFKFRFVKFRGENAILVKMKGVFTDYVRSEVLFIDENINLTRSNIDHYFRFSNFKNEVLTCINNYLYYKNDIAEIVKREVNGRIRFRDKIELALIYIGIRIIPENDNDDSSNKIKRNIENSIKKMRPYAKKGGVTLMYNFKEEYFVKVGSDYVEKYGNLMEAIEAYKSK